VREDIRIHRINEVLTGLKLELAAISFSLKPCKALNVL
jgi:hypothetical protein